MFLELAQILFIPFQRTFQGDLYLAFATLVLIFHGTLHRDVTLLRDQFQDQLLIIHLLTQQLILRTVEIVG